jgi:hypothetical protein
MPCPHPISADTRHCEICLLHYPLPPTLVSTVHSASIYGSQPTSATPAGCCSLVSSPPHHHLASAHASKGALVADQQGIVPSMHRQMMQLCLACVGRNGRAGVLCMSWHTVQSGAGYGETEAKDLVSV